MAIKKNVVWDDEALSEFKIAYDYLKEKFTEPAGKFRKAVIESTRTLAKYPERYPPDRFKKNNKGDYRAFEVYNYRVTYRITQTQIRILRLRHISREPLDY